MTKDRFNLKQLSALLTLLLAALITAPLSAAEAFADRPFAERQSSFHLLKLDSVHGAATLPSKLSARDLSRAEDPDGPDSDPAWLPPASAPMAPARIEPPAGPALPFRDFLSSRANQARAPPIL